MAKKPKSRARKQREAAMRETDLAPPEDRRSEVITVAWMLTMLATATGDLLAIAAGLIMPILAARAEEPELALALPKLLLMLSATTGAICLLLTPIVYKFRRIPPPQPITAFGIGVSIAPMVMLALRS